MLHEINSVAIPKPGSIDVQVHGMEFVPSEEGSFVLQNYSSEINLLGIAEEDKGIKLGYGGIQKSAGPENFIYSFPVLRDGAFAGMLVANTASDTTSFYSYDKVVAYLSKGQRAPRCNEPNLPIFGLMHNLLLYQLETIPHRLLSKYIQDATELTCFNHKCDAYETHYQYISYDKDGYPNGIVGGSTWHVDCGESDPSSGGDGGNSGSSAGDADPGGGNSPNSPNDNSEEEEAFTSRLRDWIVQNCGISYADFGKLNVAAGLSFENAVLTSLGVPKNYSLYTSNARAKDSRDGTTNVQPDGVIPAIEVEVESRSGMMADTEIDISVCKDCAFVEVKAYTGKVYLSTSDYQIKGLIDAASRLHHGQNMPDDFAPGLFIYTTSTGTLDSKISNYAHKKKVQLFHGKVSVNDKGETRVVAVPMENGVTKAISATTGQTGQLKCPPFTQRLDPELLNGGG